jgi:hypothetical protein
VGNIWHYRPMVTGMQLGAPVACTGNTELICVVCGFDPVQDLKREAQKH